MAIVALPARGSDIAPIFDVSSRILLVNLHDNGDTKRMDLYVHKLSTADRIYALSKAGVTTLICSCISADSHKMLKTLGIQAIWGISGPIEDVISAFVSNHLEESAFCVLPHKNYHFQCYKHAWVV